MRYLMIWIGILIFSGSLAAQSTNLSVKERSIIRISSLTATGDLGRLNQALHTGLDSGLTIYQTREVLVHLYAYCGFPRSLRGIQTFMQVLNERQTKGILDVQGLDASPVQDTGSKYQQGKKMLETLTGSPQNGPLTGYSAFAPVIDTFLKEHLFADIFGRDVLTYAERELVTIAVLSALGGVEPMLQGHFSIALHVGYSPGQLKEFLTIVSAVSGMQKADDASVVLDKVLKDHAQSVIKHG